MPRAWVYLTACLGAVLASSGALALTAQTVPNGITIEHGVPLYMPEVNVSFVQDATLDGDLLLNDSYLQLGSVRLNVDTVPSSGRRAWFNISTWNPRATNDQEVAFQGFLTTYSVSTVFVNLTIPKPDPMMMAMSPFQQYDLRRDGTTVMSIKPTSQGAIIGSATWNGNHTLAIVSRNAANWLNGILLPILVLVFVISLSVGVVWWIMLRRDDLGPGGGE